MWNYNSDFKKWYLVEDSLLKSDFDYLKQELSKTRFYSVALSGSAYVAINSLDNLYETISSWKPRNWFISTLSSDYSYTPQPTSYPTPIDTQSEYDFYTKNLHEYGLTLKNLFTPERLIKDVLDNYIQVDVATIEEINLSLKSDNYFIDGVKLYSGHKVLVKNQVSYVTLDINVDPNTYFEGPYTLLNDYGLTRYYSYYNSYNGLYTYENSMLKKLDDLDDYNKSSKLSIYVKMGNINGGKQFHLKRLLNGFYPTSKFNEPMEFDEKHNWILRNRVDYNNLFETNFYDILKHGPQNYVVDGVTYSIPERTISVGEFGVIVNTQYGVSNIIPCKYKSNLRSIDQTEKYYWICGDGTTLLRVSKQNFDIKLINLDTYSILRSISFYDNLRGVVVGDFNTIYVTVNGGDTWTGVKIPSYDPYSYNKVIFTESTKFYIGGQSGIFLIFEETVNGWSSHKNRISKRIDDEGEVLLVDNINDLYKTQISSWGLSYSFSTQSIPQDKEVIFITANANNLILFDENNFVSDKFIYLDFGVDYNDLVSISRRDSTDSFFFSNNDGIYEFDITNFQYLGVGNTYSNTIMYSGEPQKIYDKYVNKILDYRGQELLIAGNYAIFQSSLYSTEFNFRDLDSTYQKRLKSKLLFLDYDMGSKLNFFTDAGDYILPNSTYIKNNYFTEKTVLTFDNIIYGATAPSFMTQSEINWIDYWSDRQKTFGYYSDYPLSETSKVLMSKTFSGTTQSSSLLISSVSNNLTDITKIAPSFASQSSRYNSNPPLTITPIGVSSPTLFLNDYLVVLGVTNSGFGVDVGDVIRIESSVVDANLTVNRVENFSGYGKFIYMYSDFNENMINGLLTTTQSISISNLNKFKNGDEFLENLNYHPFGKAYKASNYDSDCILIEPRFNNLTSYYNLSTKINATSSNYLVFNSDYLLNYSIPDGTSSVLQTLYCNSNIYPNEIRLELNVYHNNLGDLNINLIGPNGRILNVLNGASHSLIGNTFSNTIFTTGNTYSISHYGSPYSNIVSMDLGMGVGSYSYVSDASDFNDLLTDGSAIGNWKLEIEDTSSGNIGFLRNWSIQFHGNISETLKYPDGFLKFGYTPRYNLLDYLTSINKTNILNPTFYATKEYLAMPIYKGLPLGPLTASNIYMNSAGLTQSYNKKANDNKIYFGSDLKLEWESLLVNTFVDIDVYQPTPGLTYSSQRRLVLDKYYDSSENAYVVTFHKMIDFDINNSLLGGRVDIKSRRKLSEISDDLQDLNNIQRRKSKEILIYDDPFTNYESDLNFKISTDSYAKVLFSDVDTVKNLTGVIYTDYKNEIALNITRLDKEYIIPINNTANLNGDLFIKCFEKHDLSNGDGFLLEFNGGTYSSQFLNQQYFGYQTVKQVYNEYEFSVNIPYGTNVYIGNDTGYVRYIKKDPFFNYQPVDLIDVSLNKRAKQSIKLDADNTKLSGLTYSLVNVDFERFRFRLVDGLTFDDLNVKYPWVLEAEISDAIIGQDSSGSLIWYKGNWEFGRWFGGTWYSGEWRYGDWYGGIWDSKNIKDKKLSVEVDTNTKDNTKSVWYTGRWYDGTWVDGTWRMGRFYGGTWNSGNWYNGIWNDGTWNLGKFTGGIWVEGTWNGGIFNTDNEPAYWIDGSFYGGDFENGIWYGGIFEQKNSPVRFGTNAYSSRPAIWHGGIFNGGSFYSKLDTLPGVSIDHKLSVWRTGNWTSGNWYGGVAYNINFQSGTWNGGILDEIEVIGINSTHNSLVLNGLFRFNIGDEIHVVSKFDDGLSDIGSLSNPQKYIILRCDVDTVNNITEVYINYNIDLTNHFGVYKSEVKTAEVFNVVYGQSNSSTGYSGSLIGYVESNSISDTLVNVRIKIDLETNPGLTQSLSHLLINLKSPNGQIINVKQLGDGNGDIYLNNTVFTGTQSTPFVYGSPLYEGVYEFAAHGSTGSNGYISTTSDVNDLFTNLQKGYWEIYIKSFDGLDVKVNNLELEFCYSDKIGASLNNQIVNGFDTGLRVVSNFKNANWKTGIWTNGIFDSGLFETGIWYDGVFNGTWG